jgi:hypothetical protein
MRERLTAVFVIRHSGFVIGHWDLVISFRLHRAATPHDR